MSLELMDCWLAIVHRWTTEVFVKTGYAIGEVSRTTTDIELHIVGVQMVAAK
jgi:hypothetical protein